MRMRLDQLYFLQPNILPMYSCKSSHSVMCGLGSLSTGHGFLLLIGTVGIDNELQFPHCVFQTGLQLHSGLLLSTMVQ